MWRLSWFICSFSLGKGVRIDRIKQSSVEKERALGWSVARICALLALFEDSFI